MTKYIFDQNDFDYDTSQDIENQLRDTRRELMEDALSRVVSLDDCWAVFRQAITESILDDTLFRSVIYETRVSIAKSMLEDEKDRIANIAALKVISQERNTVAVAAAQILLNDPSSISEIKHIAVALLKEQLRKDVEKEVKDQLKSDPEFIELVKRELKMKIMGI